MKRFTWVVKFEVDETWVADGFNLTDERAQEMLSKDLGWAYSHEISAKVLKAPSPLSIAKAQGYDNADVIEKEVAKGKL